MYSGIAMGAMALGGALISSDAASGAANKQSEGANRATALTAQQGDLARSDTAPFRQAGASAITSLSRLLGLGGGGAIDENDPRYKAIYDQVLAQADQAHQAQYGMSINDPRSGLFAPGQRSVFEDQWRKQADQQYTAQYGDPSTTAPDAGAMSKKFSVSDFWNDPVVQASYQSGLDLGTKALKNAAPLTTGLDSGAALKELTKFGTDYTGNMAAGSQARFVGDQTNQFNKLAALAGIGQTGVNTSTTAGMNSGNAAANIIAANSNAQGAAKIAGANSFSGGLTSIANYWQQQQMLDRLKTGGAGTTGYSNPSANNWAE